MERWKPNEEFKDAVAAFLRSEIGRFGNYEAESSRICLFGRPVAVRSGEYLTLYWGKYVHQGHATYIAKVLGIKPRVVWDSAVRVGRGGGERSQVPWPGAKPYDRENEVKSDTIEEEVEESLTDFLLPLPEGGLSTPKREVMLSPAGRRLVEELKRLYPMPVLLIGGTGWGKSVLVRQVAKELGLNYDGVNAHPGMDIGLLVGMWKPVSNGSGVSVEWSDGVLTAAIREGRAFMLEELTRAPQEAISRIFGLLDNGFRYWNLPEAGVGQIEVSPKFWFLATANPTGGGYQTVRLDKALESRFAAIIDLDKPTANEKGLIRQIVSEEMAEKVMHFVSDARRNKDTNLPTRDIVLMAELIARGFDPKRAVELAIAPKYKDHRDGLKTLAIAHF